MLGHQCPAGNGQGHGRIKNEAARGFKILTPDATFVDQGTEFGVEVAPGGGSSKIHVFKGIVDVQLRGRAGRRRPPPCRLRASYGARTDVGESGLTLVEGGGECFIRSMDETERDRHVLAYWRFEDRPVRTLLPHTRWNSRPVCRTVDSSFNGNDLYTFGPPQPMFSADVPATSVPQSGRANRSSLYTPQGAAADQLTDVYTHSQFSHAAPADIQKVTPARWTIEASVKAARLSAKAQGFLGRDTTFSTQSGPAVPARLTFRINARNRFAIGFFDVNDRFHEAIAEDLAVEAGRWYHLAAASDGRTLRLYVDATDGRGYLLRTACTLPESGSTALGKGQDDAEWTIGRAGKMGDPNTWPRFAGWIDEVRISDETLEPAEFLFAKTTDGSSSQ